MLEQHRRGKSDGWGHTHIPAKGCPMHCSCLESRLLLESSWNRCLETWFPSTGTNSFIFLYISSCLFLKYLFYYLPLPSGQYFYTSFFKLYFYLSWFLFLYFIFSLFLSHICSLMIPFAFLLCLSFIFSPLLLLFLNFLAVSSIFPLSLLVFSIHFSFIRSHVCLPINSEKHHYCFLLKQ